MENIFLYGTLRCDALLKIVAGVDVVGSDLAGRPGGVCGLAGTMGSPDTGPDTRPDTRPDTGPDTGPVARCVVARADGWRVAAVQERDFPMLLRDIGASATGILICDLPDPVAARLHHYEDAFGYHPHEIAVTPEGRGDPVVAHVYLPDAAPGADGGEWDLADWALRNAEFACAAAVETMAYKGRFHGADLQFRRAQIESRARARVAGQAMQRPVVGSDRPADKVKSVSYRADHAGFFVTRTDVIEHPRFDGTMSGPLRREVFMAADAAIVLPYDPLRDRVLLVEQFRMGPWARGARFPWMLEPVAGRIDSGETPQDTARREAREEAGLELRDLIQIGAGYPSPGCMSEYFYIFAGLCDLPDGIEGRHGMADEDEDIRTHVLDFAQAMDLLTRGEADNIPLILSLVWLSRERSRLRSAG